MKFSGIQPLRWVMLTDFKYDLQANNTITSTLTMQHLPSKTFLRSFQNPGLRSAADLHKDGSIFLKLYCRIFWRSNEEITHQRLGALAI